MSDIDTAREGPPMTGEPQDKKGQRKPRRKREFTPAGGRGDDHITRNLKKVYAEVAAEPIPQNWLDMLDQIGPKTDSKDEEGGNG